MAVIIDLKCGGLGDDRVRIRVSDRPLEGLDFVPEYRQQSTCLYTCIMDTASKMSLVSCACVGLGRFS